MLTEKEFENLTGSPESSTLDFKKEMYDFRNDIDSKNLSKFIKDVISFSNTIRSESSYIIVGIEQKQDGSKEFSGLTMSFDDAMFQDKIKDKVFPIPSFLYYQLTYRKKEFGVFEIPVKKYHAPILPVVKIKGLEVGKLYFRQGTMNAEAQAMEVIRINNWLESLPTVNERISLNEIVSEFIKRLTSGIEKLSSIFIDVRVFAKRQEMLELDTFCSHQIKGLTTADVNENPDEFKYRIHDVIISLKKVTINPFANATPATVKFEMQNNRDFLDYRLLFINSISEIEDYLFNKNGFSIITTNSKSVFPEMEGDHPVYVYVFNDAFSALYKSVRQKTIDILMKI